MRDPSLDLDMVKAIVAQFKQSPIVAKVSQARGESLDDIATEAAVGLLDIRMASNRLFQDLLPKILQIEPTEPRFADVLHDIGEEYRHIYYHIRNTKLLDYVVTED